MQSVDIAAVITLVTVVGGWRRLRTAERRRGLATLTVAVAAAVAASVGVDGPMPRVVATAAGLTAVAAVGHVLRRGASTPPALAEGLVSSLAAVAGAGARARRDGGRAYTSDAAWALAALPAPLLLAAWSLDAVRAVAASAPLVAAAATAAVLATRSARRGGPPRVGAVRGTAFDPLLGLTAAVALGAAAASAHLLEGAGAAIAVVGAVAWGLIDPGAAGMAVAEACRRMDLVAADAGMLSAGALSVAIAVRGAVAAAAGPAAIRALSPLLVAVPAAAWATAGLVAALG